MRTGNSLRSARRVAIVAMVGVVLVAAVGCRGGDDAGDDGDATEVESIASVTVPEERLTPFCEAMIELTDRLLTDPPDDSNRLIVETYTSLLDEVPVEIEAEFIAVLESLRTGRPATVPTDPTASTVAAPTATSIAPVITDASGSTLPAGNAPVVDEAFVDDDPTRRVNDYVQFSCRDTSNNPGPPPTEPDEAPDDTTDDG